jgi:hypothetical protein
LQVLWRIQRNPRVRRALWHLGCEVSGCRVRVMRNLLLQLLHLALPLLSGQFVEESEIIVLLVLETLRRVYFLLLDRLRLDAQDRAMVLQNLGVIQLWIDAPVVSLRLA